MLWQIIGDPSGMSLKLAKLGCSMIMCQYGMYYRVYKKKKEFRANCPDVRLTIQGDVIH